jgi:hypothetical protein
MIGSIRHVIHKRVSIPFLKNDTPWIDKRCCKRSHHREGQLKEQQQSIAIQREIAKYHTRDSHVALNKKHPICHEPFLYSTSCVGALTNACMLPIMAFQVIEEIKCQCLHVHSIDSLVLRLRPMLLLAKTIVVFPLVNQLLV